MGEIIFLLKRIADVVQWVFSHLALLLWLLGVAWLIVGSYFLVGALDREFPVGVGPIIRSLDSAQPLTHILGAAILIAALFAILLPRRRALRLVWSLLHKKGYSTIQELGGNIVSEREVQRALHAFSADAVQIQIIAGDADFLNTEAGQVSEITALGPRCQILLSEQHAAAPAVLKTLSDRGVAIRIYPQDPALYNFQLRGRIKRSALGLGACLFDKDSSGYRVINLANTALVGLVAKQYDTWFSNGRNSLIRHVVFDLAGVAFDGNIVNFYAAISGALGLDLRATSSDYWLVDRGLNLGEYDIVQVLEQKTGRKLTSDEAQATREAWSSTWTLNSGMGELASQLQEAGLSVSLCSNCDRENADVYDIKGYFDPFGHVYLSCEIKQIKPEDGFFEKITTELRAEPWQVSIVDDARSVTEAARAQGFETVTMPRNIEAGDKVSFMRRHLERLCIKI